MKFKEQKGFSFIEVLIVISIMGILAAIAVPSFQKFAINSDLKSAARAIQGDFFDAKERAISENEQYRITFDVGGTTYTIEQPPGTVIQTKDLKNFRNDIVIESASFGGGEPYVTFHPRGTVGGAGGNVRISNMRNSTATITINIAGKTNVQFNLQ